MTDDSFNRGDWIGYYRLVLSCYSPEYIMVIHWKSNKIQLVSVSQIISFNGFTFIENEKEAPMKEASFHLYGYSYLFIGIIVPYFKPLSVVSLYMYMAPEIDLASR